ncbi:MAG: response regulator transcription factor [Betaproteobacteria bacterium]|nr:response regulator transcription factor [Betaproteobacteria bacterium]
MKKIGVFLADDHAMLRAGLRALLESHADMTVVGEAGNGREALAGIQQAKPDIAVLDISMPELGGIEAAEFVHERCPDVRIIMLSALSDPENVHRALRAGSSGYLAKFSAPAELVQAIRKVHGGGRYLSQSISETMVDDYAREVRTKSPLESLSRRERQVLQLIAEGRSVPEIGKLISISPRTVETYRSRLYEKLGIKDMRELILFAAKHGLISQR